MLTTSLLFLTNCFAFPSSWYGVSCCVAVECPKEASDVTSCNCTLGLVTGLTLPKNNVSDTTALIYQTGCWPRVRIRVFAPPNAMI